MLRPTMANSKPKARPLWQAASGCPSSSGTVVSVLVPVMATVTVSVTDIVVLSVIDIDVVPLPGCMLVVSVAVPLAVAMLKPLSCREASRIQLLGLAMSSNNSALLPKVDPAYWAVSVKPSSTTETSSDSLRVTEPCLASRLMLHSEVGASARPLKTVRAVGATKDAESVSKSAFFKTAPLFASRTCVLATANLLTLKRSLVGYSSVNESTSPSASSMSTKAKSSWSP
mmetsp:Transcript_75414/g.166619  ORF Transcript_75414/g.166619 Transcript_75414/m.166619 type:complete len:228 (-) Transcript_75414:174-857(-)